MSIPESAIKFFPAWTSSLAPKEVWERLKEDAALETTIDIIVFAMVQGGLFFSERRYYCMNENTHDGCVFGPYSYEE